MHWSSKLVAAALAALLQACVAAPGMQPTSAASVETRAPVTILISIDGFRPDYLDRGVTPVLSRLAAEGARGAMRPSFPSKTYPNHWTLVTGLRPDRHGLVANKMEDPARPGETFTMKSDDPFWWSAAAPIWLDAERAGIRTATQFWPGSNIAIGGTKKKADEWETIGGERPSDWQQFNQSVSGTQRVAGILDWVRRPAAIRPRFLTLYFDAVDEAGHDFGPGDARTLEAVAGVDRHIGELVAGLAAQHQPANLVIVADHGMAPTSSDRVVVLGDVVPLEDVRVLETGAFVTLAPTPGNAAAVEKALLTSHPHMQCWRRGAFPARFHYGTNVRVAPIFCLAETGWQIEKAAPSEPATGGNHGYDVYAPEMAALFIGHGPAFRPATLPAFDNVDVYPLLRGLLGLGPKAGVDGTDAVFAPTLRR
ncbi:ectonucleotide pyrophosphatase/phosphodiesterase [Sphingomonas sp. LM7]|uniref:alkaline phosphatase family protein n=1 Tax=Sphingomonas sp. LM7 TaxID=1938607 RepID=UPI000983C61F|nr:ectonucleotide pyrophosphatase/phosphodiesterase [Sphingomonas sp. LM7]AQR73841.1 alkaline phosphatase family protein [Sphingomonas sp. LM7]